MRCAAFLTMLVVACGNPVGAPVGIEFATERPAYVVGDTIHIVLRNSSSTAFSYSLCLALLEYSTADGWVVEPRWPPEPPTFCPAALASLEPGGSARGLQPVLATMPSGTYRFRTGVTWPPDGRHVMLTTPPFEIAPPSHPISRSRAGPGRE